MTEFTYVCKLCDSENVTLDCLVRWNKESQKHEITTLFDKGHFCEDCNKECEIIERQLPSEPKTEMQTYVASLPLVDAMWWFIENVDEESTDRSAMFFDLRERVRNPLKWYAVMGHLVSDGEMRGYVCQAQDRDHAEEQFIETMKSGLDEAALIMVEHNGRKGVNIEYTLESRTEILPAE